MSVIFEIDDPVRCVDGTASPLREGKDYHIASTLNDGRVAVRGVLGFHDPARFIKLPTTITSITRLDTPKATFGERREPVSSLAEFQQVLAEGGNDVGGVIPVTIELMSQLGRDDQRHAFAVRPEIGDRQKAANDGMMGHKEITPQQAGEQIMERWSERERQSAEQQDKVASFQKEAAGYAARATATKRGNVKTSAPNPKDLIGITKVQVGLFPSAGTIEGARAMEDGAKKYGAYNWREHAVRMTVYLDAMERHLLALRDGEDDAEDSKVSHLGHILSCAAIIADAKACGNLIDDRPTKGAASALFAKYKKESA